MESPSGQTHAPAPAKLSHGRQRALPYVDVPDFVDRLLASLLKTAGDAAALALEFLLLIATRTNETLSAHLPQKCPDIFLLITIATTLFCEYAVSSAADMNGRRSPVQHTSTRFCATLLS